jgi:hypothetical protein
VRSKRIGEKIMASEVLLTEGIALRAQTTDFAVAKFVGSKRGATAAADEPAEKKEAAKAPAAAAAKKD